MTANPFSVALAELYVESRSAELGVTLSELERRFVIWAADLALNGERATPERAAEALGTTPEGARQVLKALIIKGFVGAMKSSAPPKVERADA